MNDYRLAFMATLVSPSASGEAVQKGRRQNNSSAGAPRNMLSKHIENQCGRSQKNLTPRSFFFF
jgi:hypothetical protein